MKKITLTERQVWFIKCAIELKNEILPLEALDDDIFKQDYGITKGEIRTAIAGLKHKLK